MAVKITNLIKFYIVLLLKEGPKHGYELIKELEKHLEKKISTSQIYPFLNELKKNRLIEVKEKKERDKKIYYLTAAGKEFVKNILVRFGELIDIAITPKLTKCSHCGCEIYKGGHKEKIRMKNYIFCCMHCAASFKRG